MLSDLDCPTPFRVASLVCNSGAFRTQFDLVAKYHGRPTHLFQGGRPLFSDVNKLCWFSSILIDPKSGQMSSVSRYDVSRGKSEYQPGSDDLVLKNKLGIAGPREMELAETSAYLDMVERSLDSLEDDQTLTSADINHLHSQWLGDIYSFAGQYRQVNVSKNGFAFCAAAYIPEQMANLDAVLARNMPCRGLDDERLAKALAEVHGEFILIHPYREGNGRLGRWLASLMALQAGHPILNFQAEMEGKGKEDYFAAVRRYSIDPSLLENWFLEILRRS